jgi:hypothetical protein
MTKLDVGDIKKGRIDTPYNYTINNHYTLDGATDLRLYRIEIHRDNKKWYFEIFVRNGESNRSIKKDGKQNQVDGDWMTIQRALPRQDIKIKSNGPAGTKVEFLVYASDGHGSFGKGDHKGNLTLPGFLARTVSSARSTIRSRPSHATSLLSHSDDRTGRTGIYVEALVSGGFGIGLR